MSKDKDGEEEKEEEDDNRQFKNKRVARSHKTAAEGEESENRNLGLFFNI